MCNPNMEAKVHELMELKRMKEELEAEIAAAEDAIKAVMGDEELLTAGAFKVSWKHYAIFMEGKMNVSELARVCGLSRPTVYKYMKMMG